MSELRKRLIGEADNTSNEQRSSDAFTSHTVLESASCRDAENEIIAENVSAKSLQDEVPDDTSGVVEGTDEEDEDDHIGTVKEEEDRMDKDHIETVEEEEEDHMRTSDDDHMRTTDEDPVPEADRMPEDDVHDLTPDFSDNGHLAQATDKTTDVIDSALKDLTPRWRNWVIRGIFTWLMIFSFMFIVWLGPLALIILILLVQIKCFHEIITIGYIVYKSHELPWFRTLSWYFLITANYFFYGESMITYFGVLLSRTEFLKAFVTYHRFISFTLYCGGFVGFVVSLVKKHYLKQFTLFGWTHVTLVIIVTQSHLIMQNIFDGTIWFLLPVSMIICNDIMAYMFGFFFGKTPLIKLSPKKTWEGFIGGAVSTVIFGLVMSHIFCLFDTFVCPIMYDEAKEALSLDCDRAPVFQLTDYALPQFLANIGALFGRDWSKLSLYPFLFHSISMSVFASLIGPFGGFFASGFKRAFKIKDFGDTIPGHGGFMDRFDCQLLMATFVHVYQSSFIKAVSAQKLVQGILQLKPEEQMQVYSMLSESLSKRGLLV